MSYDRCKEHGLARCAVCSPKKTLLSISGDDYIKRGLGILDSPLGWSPEDALDVPNLGTRDPNAGTEGPDPQSLAAAERLKPTTIEVDFGDDQPYVATSSVDSIAVAEDPVKNAFVKAIFPVEPPFQIEKTSSNPVVAAAQAYAHAEDAVIHAEMTVQELTEQLEEAEIHLKRVIVERDEKKLALKEQVR